jgi:outer membrane protein TolC
VRRVEADAKRVEANRAARVLAEEQLRVEQRRLEAGVTTTFNVLSFQRDLSEAQANEIRAIADYYRSLANLEKVRGTVLEANQIQM